MISSVFILGRIAQRGEELFQTVLEISISQVVLTSRGPVQKGQESKHLQSAVKAMNS
jgi:hypothetical protein